MKTQSEWQIRPGAQTCEHCGRAFEDGDPFFSRLEWGAEDGYRRSDFGLECWNEEQKQNALSAWRTVYRKPEPPPPEPVGRETAESLLRTFMEEDDASHRDAVFVLAVMLERRRILVERDVQIRDDGSRLRFYEHRGTGETFVVVDPKLRLDALEQVQERVVSLLGGTPPGAPADPAPAAGNV